MKTLLTRMAIGALSASMLLMMASCGDSSGSTPASHSAGSSKVDNSNAEVFTIARTSYHEDLDPWNMDGEYGEAIRQLFAEIEGEYNIKIKVDYYSPTEFQGIAQAAITNGDTAFADIMIMNLFSFGPMYAQGLLMETGELTGLDITSDVWSKPIVDLATFKNGNYGLGSAGFSRTEGTAMYYNKTLLNSLGLEDPVQLVRDGKWTWDKLRELSLQAAKDLNNDGQFTEADRFGCTRISYDGVVPMFLTSGIKAIIKDENGRLVYNMMADEASAALQKFKNTFTVNDGMFYGADLDAMTQQHQFLSGQCLFMLGSWTDDEEPAEGIEIEALPLPKYTEESSYLAPCYHNNYIITVPKTAERKELIGKVLQLIGEKTKDFNTYSIRDASVNYVDRDAYTEMFEDYVAPGFSADLFTIMINAGEPIALGTMRAIGMPIITEQPASDFIQSNAAAIQSLLDDMFNS